MLRTIFLGTSRYALPSLRCLQAATLPEVVLVITPPDRPGGRGQRLTPPPVKVFAQEQQLPYAQTENLRQDRPLLQRIRDLRPDLLITAAFGQLLSREVLDIPRLGVWNVHASLLPRWRGAAPVQWAILAGDQQTGVTIMQTNEGLDTGAILAQQALPLTEEHTTATLTEKLAELGATLLVQSIEQHEHLTPRAQEESLATYARKITSDMADIDWTTQSASAVIRQVRAFYPRPGVKYRLPGGDPAATDFLRIEAADLRESDRPLGPGELYINRQGEVWIGCAEGAVHLQRIRPANRKAMSAVEWARGWR